MTAKPDRKRQQDEQKSDEPKLDKETVKDLEPTETDEVKGGAPSNSNVAQC